MQRPRRWHWPEHVRRPSAASAAVSTNAVQTAEQESRCVFHYRSKTSVSVRGCCHVSSFINHGCRTSMGNIQSLTPRAHSIRCHSHRLPSLPLRSSRHMPFAVDTNESRAISIPTVIVRRCMTSFQMTRPRRAGKPVSRIIPPQKWSCPVSSPVVYDVECVSPSCTLDKRNV